MSPKSPRIDRTFSERLRALSPEQRALVEMQLREQGIELSKLEIAPREADREDYPLSFAQQRLWFLHQLAPESTAYHCFDFRRLQGPLDARALERALQEIVRRHEVLRTTFSTRDGRPVQAIHRSWDLSLEVVDLEHLAAEEREPHLRRISNLLFGRPFDLVRGPLMRTALVRFAPADHTCVVVMHHIVSDFWSTDIFLRELETLYAAFAQGRPSPLEELRIQYADFAIWQREYLQGEVLEEQLGYWRRQLEGVEELVLPTDRPRSQLRSHRGQARTRVLSPTLSRKVRELGDRVNATLFVPLLAAYQVLLQRWSGQRDFTVGSTIANRNREEIEGLIGFFVNTRVLRSDLGGDPSFLELAKRVRQVVLDADAHQDLPFERLVEELHPERSADSTPLFQVSFNLLAEGGDPRQIEGVTSDPSGQKLSLMGLDLELPFDLILRVKESRGLLTLLFYYTYDLFDATRAERMLRHYVQLLEAAVERPEAPLSSLPVLLPAERQQVLFEWNDSRRERPRAAGVHGLFEARAERTPEAPAAFFEGVSLTYAELERRANRLARHLRRLGVGRDDAVALCLERSLELPVAMLAVLKAGASYLPLDPSYPADRLAFMLEDARVPLLVTDSRLGETLPESGVRKLAIDLEAEAIAAEDDTPLALEVSPEQAVYLIYTSGSTGRPKGTVVTHRALHNRMLWLQESYHLEADDRVLQKTPISFDVSVWEVFWPLSTGAATVLARPGGHQDASYLAQAIAEEGITTLHFVPAMLRLFLEQPGIRAAGLRRVVASGEALPRELVGRFYQRFDVPLINMYGPSEAARASAYVVPRDESRPVVPIGRPAANNRLVLADRRLRPVPIGVAGELTLGGPVLARGYLGRPALTAERFVPDPWAGVPGARLYRTGDLVAALADGAIEFLGRTDFQVKLRGQRVELGEIEAALAAHPAIGQAVVTVRREAEDDQRLVAYVTQDLEALAAAGEAEGGEQVDDWRAVFDQTYTQAGDEVDPTFHIAGWISSYTGEGIPAEEMREWVDETVARILACGPRRLVEVGCGNGLLLYRVAPEVERYHARDFSKVALAGVARQLERFAADPSAPSYAHVELAEHTAEDFSGVESDSFDSLVLNSVAQYFPSVGYLLEVIEKGVDAVAPGGFLFLGDLRSLPMLRTFHTSVELHRAEEELSAEHLVERIDRRYRQEEELVVDPAFFLALRHHLPKVGRVEVLAKRGRFHNELTRFRYDVVIHVGEEAVPRLDGLAWRDWEDEGLDLERLAALLAAEAGPVALRRVPNARLAAEARAMELLEGGGLAPGTTAGALRAAAAAGTGIDPEALHALAEELGRPLRQSWAEPGPEGRYDVVFLPAGADPEEIGEPVFPAESARPRPWRAYANQPLQGKLARRLLPSLQSHLKERLPEYMVPGSFVLLEKLPLTPSGKVDRRALPAPDSVRPDLERDYEAPRSEIEETVAEIWCEALGLDRVGIHDNFFDLGGHSLLLVRVHGRLAQSLGREIPMVDLFRYPTVASLAEALRAEPGQLPELEEGRRRAERRARGGAAGAAGIAVVGMSGRFPGAADLESFWGNLREGVESITFYSDEELLEAGVPAQLLESPNYVKAQAFLEGADRFDAGLFGFSPREAQVLDPQQRLFLQCAWEALERAGYDPESYGGSIGVYAGMGASTYWLSLIQNPAVLEGFSPLQLSLANEKDFLPTRVSYKLGLRGPSVNVNTACSTSLVGVHLAVQALLHGECDLALAGGAALNGRDRRGYLYDESGVVSPDGHCRAFDARGGGTLDSAGVGVVVLKRLEDALAEGDDVLAVVRGTAINNDGSNKVGFTAPSIEGQAEVIAEAQAVAGVRPEEIGYVEAHGTATPLGDPIEFAALQQVFGRQPGRRTALGAVKTNVGHTGAAAGAAGLIKTILALRHREIPPSLHFEQPNPQCDFEASPLYVPTVLEPWPAADGPRRAGVSSFGLGGTNAHVILEEAPEPGPSGPSRPWQLMVLSAHTETALESARGRLAAHLRAHPGDDLADVAHTLRVGRRRLRHRQAWVCRDGEDAVAVLETAGSPRLLRSLDERRRRPVAFLLSGVGDHYPQMGRELYEAEPTFRAAVDRCARLLEPHLGLDLRELLFPEGWQGPESADGKVDLKRLLGRGEEAESSPLQRTAVAQPAVFVLEVALAELLAEWGVEPEAMIGYSLGEYTAAYLAGVMSLEDALAVVAARARWIDELPAGAMTALPLGEAEVVRLLGDELSIAALNGPEVTVVAGPEEAVEALEASLATRDVAFQRLRSTHAFHSKMMRPVAERLSERLREVSLHAPRIPYLSNVTGTWITAQEATDPAYWARHLCQTVRFAEGLAELWDGGEGGRPLLLEVGPGQALGTSARQHAGKPAELPVVTTVRDARERRSDVAFLLEAVGRLWLAGVRLDWPSFVRHEQRRRLPLPTYPFEEQVIWVSPRAAGAGAAEVEAGPSLPASPTGLQEADAGAGEAKKADLADWFLVPAWRPSEVPPGELPEPGATTLLFIDRHGLGSRLGSLLELRGDDVVLVEAGEGFADLGAGLYVVDPASPDDYLRLAEALRAEGKPLRSVLHLWTLTGAEEEADGAAQSERLLDLGFFSLLHLAQALGGEPLPAPLDLLVVTDHLHAVGRGEKVVAEKAAVLGPCRVLPHEIPGLRCRHVDIELPAGELAADDPLLDRLLDEIDARSYELAVAYRHGERWVQQLESVRFEGTARRRSPLRQGGTYLVTGGLGGLGRSFARHLAESLGAKLVLTARAALPEGEARAAWLEEKGEDDPVSRRLRDVEAMEAAGAEVMVAAADVTDLEAMKAVVEAARERFGEIHGVLHTAGVPGGGLVQLKTREMAEAVLGAKVRGTRVLEEVFRDTPLDLFVLSSSMTAFYGGLGQVDYAAANAVLDAFAQAQAGSGNRFAETGRVTSINWGLWREVGMGARAEVPASRREQHERTMALGMTPEEGVEAFRRAIERSRPQVLVSPRDAAASLDRYRGWSRVGFVGHLEQPVETAQLPSAPRPSLSSDYVAPRNQAEEQLAAIWQEFLGVEQVGAHDNFFELGGDSLLATRMMSRIRRVLDVDLPLAIFFEAPTIAQMAEVAGAEEYRSADEEVSEIEAVLASIQDLSDDELDEELKSVYTED